MFSAFSNEFPAMAAMYAILLGIGSTIGMISMYYILGVVAKKYGSMRYIRLSILLIGICGGVSGVVVGNLIYRINAIRVSIAASLIAAAFMLIFLILSPLLSQPKYFNDWAKDSCMAEINISDAGPFIQYRLSKREIDICKLLLEGYTLRQISSILAIAYSTVNTYCTSLYRKLNINSRTELIMMFKDHIEELK
jgi:DNA-binding CsgD family transcriptional regulator